ncbi:hypothetical protein PR048_016979 [Dryococelus australis]|uniref:Uncharacterized protein n=1 Tax=Dryococelus australis TaxID=614101 RepID=A0ABQ9H877_9NEOP|nr:hypothetical protein PR048_016979 [Dryococelus australis]
MGVIVLGLWNVTDCFLQVIEPFLLQVIDLDRSDVCATQRNWTDYIYYIIAGQVVLLAFLVGKFLYDYWVFKSTGYLPWIASKMPKMPCDWVFET